MTLPALQIGIEEHRIGLDPRTFAWSGESGDRVELGLSTPPPPVPALTEWLDGGAWSRLASATRVLAGYLRLRESPMRWSEDAYADAEQVVSQLARAVTGTGRDAPHGFHGHPQTPWRPPRPTAVRPLMRARVLPDVRPGRVAPATPEPAGDGIAVSFRSEPDHMLPAPATAWAPGGFLRRSLEFIEREGWEAASLDRLASAAGIAVADVVRAYPTSAHVMTAIAEQIFESLPEDFADEVEPDSPLRDRLYAVLAHELRMMQPYRRFMRALLQEAIIPFSRGSILQIPIVTRYLRFVAAQIRMSRDRGEIGDWVPPWLTAGAFWLIHLRVIVHWLDDQSPAAENTHALADRWIIALVEGLGGSPPE